MGALQAETPVQLGPDAPGPGPGRPRRGTPLLVLETMRPKQWVKNLFVFAGLLFSGELLELGSWVSAIGIFVAFCLVSGATYLLNDALDAEGDRHNARTASRPIARGDLSVTAGLVACALSAVGGLALALLINWQSLAVLGGYLAIQIAYSKKLKHVLFVDVMTIAAGFVLRAVAGGTAVSVPVSSWLLLCTGLLAIFLGFTKRRAEAVAMGGTAQPKRVVLESYSVGLLDELIAVVTPSTVVAYSLYAVTGARTQFMLLTVPFVMYGIFRVLFLIHHRTEITDEPAAVVLRDRPLLACVIGWALVAGVIVAIAGGSP